MEEVSSVESAGAMHGQGGDGSAAEQTGSPTPGDDTYLSHFSAWLGGMSEEARQLAFLLEREEASAPLRRLAADSLNQLLHAADMLPEGTEALGYLETSFAFRLLAAEMSEAAFTAPKLPKPRPPKLEPVAAERLEPAGAAEPLLADAAVESSAFEAPGSAAEQGADEVAPGGAELSDDEQLQAMDAEPVEAVATEAAWAEGERVAVHLPAAPEEESPAAEAAGEALEADGLEGEGPEAEAWEGEALEADAWEAQAAAVEEEPEQEPEPAQASDESYAVVRRLAPQAVLVRAFLGAEDAERLRRLVLEQRSRPSRGRSSKDVLLAGELRTAAASEARDWADAFEPPEFGSTQHDLLRLRTFMKTRVRRAAS